MVRTVALVSFVLAVASPSPARADVPIDPPVLISEDVALWPPVAGPVTRHFEVPLSRWGPGHRGIDFGATPGTPVRAPATGRVTFAGDVASTSAVTISHGVGVVSTVSSLREILVREGEWVAAGAVVGTSAFAHPGGEEGVHLSVRVGGTYLDPSGLLTRTDVSEAIHLAPLVTPPADLQPSLFGTLPRSAGSVQRKCRPALDLAGLPPVPPNDNIAIAVAGIGSSTSSGLSADMYEHGPEELGFPMNRVYRFSYAGIDGPHLHRPYASTATFASIDRSARRLADLLKAIAERHPHRDVDLIAHSQGGIVARRFLESYAHERGLPRVEHLVTFSSPHSGAPLGDIATALESSFVGRFVNGAVSDWARSGGVVPDPRSDAVRDLTRGSPLMGELVQATLPLGTRATSLGIANDVVVPATQITIPASAVHVVGPRGLNGHSAILTSPTARAIAYAALRDGPPTCPSLWDTWGPRTAHLITYTEEALAQALNNLLP